MAQRNHFGYLRRTQFVSKGGRISRTIGENGSSKQIVARIAIAAREAFGQAPDGTKRGHIETSIVHTVATRNDAEGSTVRATIAKIESNTDCKAWKAWKQIYPNEEPEGFFVS